MELVVLQSIGTNGHDWVSNTTVSWDIFVSIFITQATNKITFILELKVYKRILWCHNRMVYHWTLDHARMPIYWCHILLSTHFFHLFNTAYCKSSESTIWWAFVKGRWLHAHEEVACCNARKGQGLFLPTIFQWRASQGGGNLRLLVSRSSPWNQGVHRTWLMQTSSNAFDEGQQRICRRDILLHRTQHRICQWNHSEGKNEWGRDVFYPQWGSGNICFFFTVIILRGHRGWMRKSQCSVLKQPTSSI